MIRFQQLLWILFAFSFTNASAQIIDFEFYNLEVDTFLNGSDGSGGFTDGSIFFPNDFTDTYGSWSGWAISTDTDVTTAGFTNQYASITGGGADNSLHYAASFVSGNSRIIGGSPIQLTSMDISNSTYAFLSMRDGDSFAKKFGGETGDDPDFYLLTIKGYQNGALKQDSIDFYLADFRFADNSQDYILDEWSTIDLSSLNVVDSLELTLSSSDNGAFGMNTPAYFCLDNFNYEIVISTDDVVERNDINIFPNPSSDYITIDIDQNSSASVVIYDAKGIVTVNQRKYLAGDKIDINTMPSGLYFINIETENKQTYSQRLIKK